MKVRIAVAQVEIKLHDPMSNLKKAENLIAQASKKADIIVFPEDFITGPIGKRRDLIDSKQKYVATFQELAKKYAIDIVPGSIVEGDNGVVYNTSYYIDFSGKIKAKYRKINLWHSERSYITPGSELPVFNTRFGKIGLIICWDLIFPELFRKMVKGGVKIVICPSYWLYGDAGRIGNKHDKNSEIKNVNSLCVARAFENEIVMVYCNAAGELQLPNYKDTLIGHSQVTIPFKGVIRRLEHHKEEMFIEEIDSKILDDAESVYKIKKDLKNRVIG